MTEQTAGPAPANDRPAEPATEPVLTPPRLAARIRAGDPVWPAEPGRYRLAVARACPFAGRALISRRLLGLEGALSIAVADPIQDERGWRLLPGPDGRDPVLGIRFLSEAYFAAVPGYDGGVSVPAVIDIASGEVVTNDFGTLTLDLATEWGAHQRDGAPELYPKPLRPQIDAVNAEVLERLATPVYQAGLATSQESYERAYRTVFAELDALEERLTRRRYLVGDTLTEADIRLFCTLVRFDAVYHGHFRCNRNTLTAMPALWGYARDLFQTPGFGDTIDFDQIKRHYFHVLDQNNPRHIVPAGPDLSGWLTPHGREGLGGRPFGDGTPPGPPPAGETVPPAGRPVTPNAAP